MYGNITDIQRFSLNDGDGIRTTVFFKGCNMHCTWCHNPETIGFAPDLMFYENKCIHCGHCLKLCPRHAHILSDGRHTIDRGQCNGCGRCVSDCAAQALAFSCVSKTVDEVMFQILQDEAYYQASGGGVTLSGGEALCQLEFTKALVDQCVANRIKVALETNLLHCYEDMEEVLKKMELIMFDIKIIDREKHKKFTGADNSVILDNAAKIDRLGIPMVARTPLIPGVTDSDDNLSAIAGFVSGLKNVRFYELLNYNPLGAAKYKALDREECFQNARPLGVKQLDHIRTVLAGYKIRIR